MIVWGIHMGEHVGFDPIENGYVAIGWHQLGDLNAIGASREKIKSALGENIAYEKPGAIPVHAGVLYRFLEEIQIGDIIIYPSKVDRQVNIGKVTSDYRYVKSDPHGYPNQRSVEWLASCPRTDFKQTALYEIGSAMTMFKVRTHANDFLIKIGLNEGLPEVEVDDEPDDESATENISVQADLTTKDFIIKRLYNQIDHYEFEHFVGHLLECMGYKARVSQQSGDGGVDVIAHKDTFGFEPPILKVQCKQITSNSGEPEASQLLGTLGEGEYALFVNLGSYTKAARNLERNKARLRLIDGEELAKLVMAHYDNLSPKYRTLLPLKQIHVPDL